MPQHVVSINCVGLKQGRPTCFDGHALYRILQADFREFYFPALG
jgi:hypothetical protein